MTDPDHPSAGLNGERPLTDSRRLRSVLPFFDYTEPPVSLSHQQKQSSSVPPDLMSNGPWLIMLDDQIVFSDSSLDFQLFLHGYLHAICCQ